VTSGIKIKTPAQSLCLFIPAWPRCREGVSCPSAAFSRRAATPQDKGPRQDFICWAAFQ